MYYICIKTCLRNDDKWLDIDMKYINDDKPSEKVEEEKIDVSEIIV
jgi:hypothetical protein